MPFSLFNFAFELMLDFTAIYAHTYNLFMELINHIIEFVSTFQSIILFSFYITKIILQYIFSDIMYFGENAGIYLEKIPCPIIAHYMDVFYWSSTISNFHNNSST